MFQLHKLNDLLQVNFQIHVLCFLFCFLGLYSSALLCEVLNLDKKIEALKIIPIIRYSKLVHISSGRYHLRCF
jgi:hypothetical protein